MGVVSIFWLKEFELLRYFGIFPITTLSQNHKKCVFARSFNCFTEQIFDITQLCIRVLFGFCVNLGAVVLFRGDILSLPHTVHHLSVLQVRGTNLVRLSLVQWHIIYVLCACVWRLSDKIYGNFNLYRRSGSVSVSLLFLFFFFFVCVCVLFCPLCQSNCSHFIKMSLWLKQQLDDLYLYVWEMWLLQPETSN